MSEYDGLERSSTRAALFGFVGLSVEWQVGREADPLFKADDWNQYLSLSAQGGKSTVLQHVPTQANELYVVKFKIAGARDASVTPTVREAV